MKRVEIAVLSVIAAVTIGVGLAPAFAGSGASGAPFAGGMAALVGKGISPVHARRALEVQAKIAPTNLAKMVETTLGDAYAGLWYVPASAQFHVGATSPANARKVARAVARSGLSAYVVETRVRSTWAALAHAQLDWSRRLARLMARAQAMSGLSASRNALLITLSSSVSSAERVAMERQAAASSVSIMFATMPSSRIDIKRKATCTEPFAEKAVFCESTMVSGVRIETPKTGCTGGPLLISGAFTYLLTAGHCFNKEEPGGINYNNLTVTSAYPTEPLVQKEIGKEGKFYNNNERDMGEVRVSSANFSQAQPTPVPALMAQWGKEPKTPHTVDGEMAATEGVMACHEGQASGEHCGEIKNLNVEGAGTKHVVEIGACSNKGDSGGPYFIRSKGGSIFMIGTEVGGPEPDCTGVEPYKSFFEPLKDLAGAAGFGILSSFPGQELLTTANETRPAQKGGFLPEKTSFIGSGKNSKLRTAAGTEIKCEVTNMTAGTMESNSHGTVSISFEKCKTLGFATNSLGDKGEVILAPSVWLLCLATANNEKLEWDIWIEPTSPLHVEIPIAGTLLKISGGVIGTIKENAKSLKKTLTFKANKGVSEPKECVGLDAKTKVANQLVETNENGKPEPAALEGEATIEAESKKTELEIMDK